VPALAKEVVEWHTCGLPWKQTPARLFLLPHAFNTPVFYQYHLCTFRANSCLSRVDHERKIRSRRQRTDIGKCYFVNRTIQHWSRVVAEVLGTLPCKPIIFLKKKEGKESDNRSELKEDKVCWKSFKSVEKRSKMK